MDVTWEPLPGSFGLSRIDGFTGFWVAAGQWFVEREQSPFTHAFVVLDDDEVLEGDPGGARIVPLSKYLGREDVFWSERPELDAVTRAAVVAKAREFVGHRYSFASYLGMGMLRLGFRPMWLTHYIRDTKASICSALIDRIYWFCDVHLFDDGRLHGDVSPRDLFRYALDLPA